MARHLKLSEWLEAFEMYDKSYGSLPTFWKWYCNKFNRKNTKETKKIFRKKYYKFKISNDIEILQSKTGKSLKKNKGVGRKPKPHTHEDLVRIYNKLEDWEKFEIFKRYNEITNEKSKNNKNKEAQSLNIKQVKKWIFSII
ncbi:hypothetical protein ACW95P_00905 [Candidatus Mycoplasma pogonae]